MSDDPTIGNESLPTGSQTFAIISDIHANIDALDAVLADIATTKPRGIICLGDMVGYGPSPAACVQRIMDTCEICVLGNHEVMMFIGGKNSAREFGRTLGLPLELAHEQLNTKQMAWLRSRPLVVEMEEVTIVHSALGDPIAFDYITDKDSARDHFDAQEKDVCFYGHTHIPAVWQRGKRGGVKGERPVHPRILAKGLHYAINPGGVGQPRDNDPRAGYALYDLATRRLEHRRVEYDIPRAQARFAEAGMPESNGRRIALGR